MSNSSKPPSGPPRRNSSLEMTAVMPRDKLPPISVRELAALELDPDHPETKELLARATTDERRTAITLVQCPACLAKPCPCCATVGMVEPVRAARYQAANATAVDEPAVVDHSTPPDDAA